MKVFISPSFDRPDEADGGIRRVIEAQKLYLPKVGIEVVSSEEQADIIAIHAGSRVDTMKPVVAHCHGLYWNEYEWAAWALKLNTEVIRVMRIASQITAPSEWVANSIRRAMWSPVTVLNHGVDTTEWKPVKPDEYILWNKTRLDPVCDIAPVLSIAESMSRYRFVSTYGGDHDLPNLTVTGPLPHDQAKLLVQKAGVYLCTSRETFGIGTIEAMACGVPVVGWNWGGQAEIVTHEHDGYLAQPGNYEELEHGIQYCLQHRDAMGKAARRTVLDKYTWDKAITRYVPVYEAALAHRVNPKVSVIIPNYKLEQYLGQSIQSVLDQDYDDYEIIVVNDCSPTWSENNVQTDPRIKVLTTPSNLYLAGALNYGIEHSSGEYIIALDADNMLGMGALSVLTSQLDKYRGLDIAYGRVKFINPDGSPDTTISGDGISEWPPDNFSFTAQMQHRNQIPSTAMYRRKYWERSGGYRRRCRTAEDADFWCRITSIGASAHKVTDAVTLIYRQRSDSMSRVEKDWPWHEWFPWHADRNLTPFAAPRDDVEIPSVQSYDPPVITVVIPVGVGHEQIVVDAVDSIIAQSYQKWSIIVVSDTSSDLASLPSFVQLAHTPIAGSGPAVARNIGVGLCKSPYFLPLDADDILVPSALQDMLDVAREYGGYVYSDWMVHESGEVHQAPDWDAQELQQALFHAVTCLYPTKAWKEVGGFDEHISWEDWDFALAICEKGYCGSRVPKPLLQYRMSAGTVREKLFADKDKNIDAMRKKWEGKLVACGTCGGGGGQQVQWTPTNAMNDSPEQMVGTVNARDVSDLVQVQFIKEGQGTRVYRGPATGHEYYFGSDPGEDIRYVHKSDLEHFLKLRDFELYTGDRELVS
jgi:glycosyltransferase involved in cell wall biosynthesis